MSSRARSKKGKTLDEMCVLSLYLGICNKWIRLEFARQCTDSNPKNPNSGEWCAVDNDKGLFTNSSHAENGQLLLYGELIHRDTD